MSIEIYHISYEAYTFLADKAVKMNFVRPLAKRNNGICAFINELAYIQYIDNRPDDITQEDEIRKANFYVPKWNAGNIRQPRGLNLNEDSIQLFIKQAIELQIMMSRVYKQGPYWRSGTAVVAAVLEAIGIEWLIPKHNKWPEFDGPRKEPLIKRDPERDTLV